MWRESGHSFIGSEYNGGSRFDFRRDRPSSLFACPIPVVRQDLYRVINNDANSP